jgi:hypothetical protein
VDGREWRTTFSGGLSQFYSRDTSRNVFVDARRRDPIEEIDRRVNIDQLLTAIDINMAATNGETRFSARAAGSYTLDWRPVTLVGSSRSSGDDTPAHRGALYIDTQHYRLGLFGADWAAVAVRFGRVRPVRRHPCGMGDRPVVDAPRAGGASGLFDPHRPDRAGTDVSTVSRWAMRRAASRSSSTPIGSTRKAAG